MGEFLYVSSGIIAGYAAAWLHMALIARADDRKRKARHRTRQEAVDGFWQSSKGER